MDAPASIKCCAAACNNPATHCICMRLWAPFRRGKPAEGVTGLVLCGPHSLQVILDEIMSKEGWKKISDGFASAGKVRPDRNLAELYTMRLDDPKLVEFVANFPGPPLQFGPCERYDG